RLTGRCSPAHLPRRRRASCSDALEIRISPANGLSSSRSRRIAGETDRAQTIIVATTVALDGGKRPKLTKRMGSQNTSSTKMSGGMELPVSAANQRARARLMLRSSACILQRALSVVLRRQLIDLVEDSVGRRPRLQLRRSRVALGPHTVERVGNGAPEQI